MANAELTVQPRTVLGKKTRALRRQGMTPANIFGHRIDSTAVQAETVALGHTLKGMSKNQIINLKVEGEGAPRTVVIRDIMRNPLNGHVVHIDFYQVSMTERMRAEVPVVMVGSSDAVATYGGVLLQTLERVAVEALPADIPAEFQIDVSVLAELEQSIHVRDLAFDADKVIVHTDPDVVLARVASPRVVTAEEEGAAPAEGEAAAGEPGAEGAAPAPAEDSSGS